jgi:hypothetical protein
MPDFVTQADTFDSWRLKTNIIYDTVNNQLSNYSVISVNTTLTGTMAAVICNSASAITVTLPSASANAGKYYLVKNKNTGTVTINAASSGLIDGQNTTTIATWSAINILSDGVTWNIL